MCPAENPVSKDHPEPRPTFAADCFFPITARFLAVTFFFFADPRECTFLDARCDGFVCARITLLSAPIAINLGLARLADEFNAQFFSDHRKICFYAIRGPHFSFFVGDAVRFRLGPSPGTGRGFPENSDAGDVVHP